MHEEGFSFLTSGYVGLRQGGRRDGLRDKGRRPGEAALAVHLRGSLTILAGTGQKNIFAAFNSATLPFKQPRNGESDESVRMAG
jgi:hypothetical protein